MEFDQSTSEPIYMSSKKKSSDLILRASLSKWNGNQKIMKNAQFRDFGGL